MVDSGPFATGAFGGYLEDIFENDAALYDYRGPKTNDGKQVFVYGYRVAESVSHYEVHAHDSWVITGYSGTFEVDPQTLDIERLTIETSELPAETQLCLADAALDYQRVQIGEGTFLLPRQSQLHLILRNGQETNNTVVFSACREFRVESAVRFESPDGKPVGTLEAPVVPGKPRPPLPSGLAVDLRLTTAIDTDTSAAGDPVTATVVNAVHAVRSLDTLIPAGALVHGRACLGRQRLLIFLVGHERCVGGLRRARVARIVVSGALVLARRIGILPALEQGVGEQIVGGGRIRIVGKETEVVAIPVGRGRVVLGLFGLLGSSVIVLRHILQIDFELFDHLRIVAVLPPLPEWRVEAVSLRVLEFALQHQIREAALSIGLDGSHGEGRCMFVDRIPAHEGAIGGGGILEALLVHVKITETRIEHPGVGHVAAPSDEIIQ